MGSDVDDGHTSIHDGGRTFRRVRFEEYRIYDAAGEPYLDPPDDSRKVFLLRGQKLLPETVDVHSTNQFDVTQWESMYSSVLKVGQSPFNKAAFAPIVDDNYHVIGHVGWADGNDLIVPEFTVRNNRQFWSLLQQERLNRLRQRLLDDNRRFEQGLFPNSPFHPPKPPPTPARVDRCGYHPPNIAERPTIWDQARLGPLPANTEDPLMAQLANLEDFLRGGGEVSVGRHFQKPGEASYLSSYSRPMDGQIGSPKMPFSSGCEFLILVDPEGHVQGVVDVQKNLKTEDEWLAEKTIEVLDIADKVMTVLMVVEVVPIAVALIRMGAIVAKGAAIRAIRLVLDAAAKAALKRLLEQGLKRVGEETLAKTAEKLGKLTADEMIAHLKDIVGKHPELRRLMAARVLTEQRLTSASLEALGDWARAYGRTVVWKTEAEMVKVTKDARNLMTLQGNELWINGEAKALKEAQEFYKEVVHELTSDSLGYRGSGLANRYVEMRNGMKFTDQTLLENAVMRGDIEAVVRFFAGE